MQTAASPARTRTTFEWQRLTFASQGYGATLLSFGPFSAVYFMLYEEFKRMARMQKPEVEDIGTTKTLLAASAAASTAAWVTSPLDLAKLRLQVRRHNAPVHNARWSTGAYAILT